MTVEPFQRKIYSVSQLTLLIKARLEEDFRDFWVEGELSNLKRPASGHLYFTLKDQTSQIRTVMFRSMGRFMRFSPRDGQSVLCRGRLSVYEPRGDYQIIVEYLEPKGIGALQLAFEELKERLAKEGLFDETRKRPLPLFPRSIGVITSPSGAAVRDILNILDRRRGGIHIILYPVQVQGEGAAKEIAHALDELNQWGGIDVIIVGRGGGSLEDLWAFNEEVVARAIHRSRLPVISAVGHETDYTISDFVADLRAPTPSAAAELVSKSREEWIEHFQTCLFRLRHGMGDQVEAGKGRLQEQMGGLFDPRMRIDRYLQRLDELDGRLRLSFHHVMLERRRSWHTLQQGLRHLNPVEGIQRSSLTLTQLVRRLGEQIRAMLVLRRRSIGGMMETLDALSPLSVLERGYSITWRLPSLEVLREAETVRPGDRVKVRLFRGELRCMTEEVLPVCSDATSESE